MSFLGLNGFNTCMHNYYAFLLKAGTDVLRQVLAEAGRYWPILRINKFVRQVYLPSLIFTFAYTCLPVLLIPACGVLILAHAMK